MKQKSLFSEWFKEQFGKRPSNKTTGTLFSEMIELQRASDKATALWKATTAYDRDRDLSLITWLARERIK